MLKLLLTAALLAFAVMLYAQGSLSGIVVDEKHQPLPGADVTIASLNAGTTTDKDGKFLLPNLANGSYSITVRLLGFRTNERKVEIAGDALVSIVLADAPIISDEVIVSALRANEKTPTTFSNVTREDIAKQNYGQDLPLLLNWTPSLVTTSDAGTGVGYTGLRIRGSDASHINVTINGIPYNDSESQSVYWVDVPDVASSTQSIQVQRGVGTSTNGAGAFGGSVNVETTGLQEKAYAEISNSYGSFNTHKHTLRAGTGLINGVWAFDGRVSKIKSDGYVERAAADLDSYYLSGGYYGKKTFVKAIMFGGHEETYQSWYGIDPDMLKINRRYNYAGAIYNADGSVSFYDRQVDDYRQDHNQLHFGHRVNDAWNINAAVHYTYGRGYFEQYLQGQTYAGLGLENIVIANDTISSGDFITRQWLDNRFYGSTFSVHHAKDKLDLTIGGALNKYGNAKHYGEIIWAEYAGPNFIRKHYYDAVSEKTDFNVFAKLTYDLTDKLSSFLDVQYRRVGYGSHGLADDLTPYTIDDHFNFFNPKAGLTYSLNTSDALYASFAQANREPTRADYLGGIEKPRSEKLSDVEAGWRKRSADYTIEVNGYYMFYKDQLVLTGQLNSTGYPVRANVGKSYRRGIEISGSVRIVSSLMLGANVTYSQNKNQSYNEVNDLGNVVQYKNTDLILSPRWIAGSQLAWNVVRNVQVTLLTKYVGRQYLDNTQKAAVKLDDYLINDLRFAWSIKPSFVKEIELGMLLNNLFNERYISNGAAYGGVPYYYPQAGRNYLGRITIRF